MTSIVYLHGFNSSAKAQKAAIARRWFAAHYPAVNFFVPQLPDDPDRCAVAIEQELKRVVAQSGVDLGLIGSSMGGFFANYFAEQFACPAVLINPVVYPHKLLGNYLGSQTNPHTGASYYLDQGMMSRLKTRVTSHWKDPQARLVLLQTGDEVLDYREAEIFYARCQLEVESGGDHGFQSFDRWLPRIAQFLKL